MDLSQFLDVTCDEGDAPLDSLTEDDIVLIDEEEGGAAAAAATPRVNSRPPLHNGNKRPNSLPYAKGPPVKKARRALNGTATGRARGGAMRVNNSSHRELARSLGLKELSAHAVELLKTQNITLKKVTEGPPPPPAARPRPAPPPPRLPSSVTWKYKQLPENQYTADIRKQELLKDYEPERCMCKEPPEGELACGEGCINRSTFTECDPELCVYKERCGNQRIQRRQYAPGLERFMTQKKGWGVRARQSIARGAFILEYTGEMCTSAEFEKRMMSRYMGDKHHYCLGLDSKTMIDAHRAGSECRFVNHSCDPNCEMEKWTVGGLYRMALFAIKDILPGEEICYDYNFSLFNTDQGQECKCGARSCRGVIGGKGRDFLITLKGEDAAMVAAAGGGGGDMQNSGGQQKVALATDPAGQVAADEKWFRTHLSEEDAVWLEKHAARPQQLEARTIKCTVCNECLNFKLLGQVQRHPELGVIMCNKCRKAYGKGGWDRDKEGNDEFCRWCSQGGQIYLCDFCPKAFCNQCLKWNLGRKYIKKIEDEDKWKCLACDPTDIRQARADYYAIHKYHKERSAKSSGKVAASPKMNGRMGGAGRPGASPGRGRLAAGGAAGAVMGLPRPTGQVRGGKAPRGAAFVRGPATQFRPRLPSSGRGAGGSPAVIEPVRKHFVDAMLLEADRAANRFRSLIHEIRRSWSVAGRDDKTVLMATRKIREALVAGRAGLEAADTKVIDIYRTKVEDADMRDIEPRTEGAAEEVRLMREEEIFAKSELVDTNGIESLETTPDLPFSLEEEEDEESEEKNGEVKEENGQEEGQTEEEGAEEKGEEGVGIQDMSVDDLEGGEEKEAPSRDQPDQEETKSVPRGDSPGKEQTDSQDAATADDVEDAEKVEEVSCDVTRDTSKSVEDDEDDQEEGKAASSSDSPDKGVTAAPDVDAEMRKGSAASVEVTAAEKDVEDVSCDASQDESKPVDNSHRVEDQDDNGQFDKENKSNGKSMPGDCEKSTDDSVPTLEVDSQAKDAVLPESDSHNKGDSVLEEGPRPEASSQAENGSQSSDENKSDESEQPRNESSPEDSAIIQSVESSTETKCHVKEPSVETNNSGDSSLSNVAKMSEPTDKERLAALDCPDKSAAADDNVSVVNGQLNPESQNVQEAVEGIHLNGSL